jgi:hypothetical protein
MKMPKPKIAIMKKFMLSDGKHFRFYSAAYDGRSKKSRPRPIVFNLEPVTEFNKRGEAYPILNIHTEKELAVFIRDHFGYGEYWVYAMVKGREGIWTFWRGSIQQDGWIFYIRDAYRQDLEKAERQLQEFEPDDQDYLMAGFQNELKQEHQRNKRKWYGLHGFLRPSGRRGQFNMWEEPDRAFETEHKPKNERRNVDPSTMSLDEINSFE